MREKKALSEEDVGILWGAVLLALEDVIKEPRTPTFAANIRLLTSMEDTIKLFRDKGATDEIKRNARAALRYVEKYRS